MTILLEDGDKIQEGDEIQRMCKSQFGPWQVKWFKVGDNLIGKKVVNTRTREYIIRRKV